MLPRPIDGICLSPFLNGTALPQKYLVEAGARNFVVNFRTLVLIEALKLDGEPAAVAAYIHKRTNEVISEEELHISITKLPAALFDSRIASEHQTPITCRITLFPARTVKFMATWTAHLFSVPFLTASVIAVVMAIPFICLAVQDSLHQVEMTWGTIGVLGLGFIVSAIAHELGHASAVVRSGLKPGHIGFGVYWFYPVLYTDVNAAWKLAPRQRVIVDLGGIYFQILFVAGLTPLAFLGPVVEAVQLLLLFNLYSILQNLNPVFKMDGYWILADVAQVPNLHGRTFHYWLRGFTRRGADTRTRLVFIVYGLTVGSYFGYVIALLPSVIRLQLLPRMNSAGAHLVRCAESGRQFAWSEAFGQLGLALQAAAVPAIAVLTLILWLVSWWRRSIGSVRKSSSPLAE